MRRAAAAGLAGLALAWLPACGSGQKSAEESVPAVAKTETLEATSSPETSGPQANPTVKVHRAPRPLTPGAATHDWPSFLGPTHNAVSTETHLLKKWPAEGPPLVWEMARGTGYASPAIAGGRLVYFHREEDREIAECLHPEDGRRYWQFSYETRYEDRFGYNNGPRASSVIDGERVFTFGAEGMLHCLKLSTGECLWKRNLAAEYKVPQDFFGVSSTPLVEGNLLIVQIGAPGGPGVVALDKRDGKQVWGVDDQWGPSYASPVPAVLHGRRRVLVFAGGESKPPAGGLLCIDPEKGRIDFRFPWRSAEYESVNSSCPVVAGERIFVSASYETGGALVEALPDQKSRLVWTTQEMGTHFNTCIHRDGYLYGFDGRHPQTAELACVDLKTGKSVWRWTPEWEEEVEAKGKTRKFKQGTFRGSLLWADGAFLCLGESGHLLWLELSPEGHKELARAWLFAAPESWTLPVLSRGLLYVCQNHRGMFLGEPPRLLCYDLRGE